MNDLDALQAAARLHAMGIAVKSPELLEKAQAINSFHERGGNRAMRRATCERFDWAKAFREVEGELIAEGYTCDDLAPAGKLVDGSNKKCVACETSLRLRAKLLGSEA